MLIECEDGTIPVIITNRHVVQGYDDAKVFISPVDGSGNVVYGTIIELNIHQLQNAVTYHTDPTVDLAAIYLGGPKALLDKAGRHQRVTWLPSSLILDPEMDEEIDSIEDVYVYGYPNGIWDDVYNMPIVRRGITATPAFHQFRGESKFLIDCAIFPGSSGSPVVIWKRGSDGDGMLRLAGVNSAVFQNTIDGSLTMTPLPDKYDLNFNLKTPNNIGIAVMAFELHAIFEELAKRCGQKYCRRQGAAKEKAPRKAGL